MDKQMWKKRERGLPVQAVKRARKPVSGANSNLFSTIQNYESPH